MNNFLKYFFLSIILLTVSYGAANNDEIKLEILYTTPCNPLANTKYSSDYSFNSDGFQPTEKVETIGNNKFNVFFKPMINLKTGRYHNKRYVNIPLHNNEGSSYYYELEGSFFPQIKGGEAIFGKGYTLDTQVNINPLHIPYIKTLSTPAEFKEAKKSLKFKERLYTIYEYDVTSSATSPKYFIWMQTPTNPYIYSFINTDILDLYETTKGLISTIMKEF